MTTAAHAAATVRARQVDAAERPDRQSFTDGQVEGTSDEWRERHGAVLPPHADHGDGANVIAKRDADMCERVSARCRRSVAAFGAHDVAPNQFLRWGGRSQVENRLMPFSSISARRAPSSRVGRGASG